MINSRSEAQTTNSPEIEIINQPFHWNKASNTTTKLEKQSYFVKLSKGLVITGSNKSIVRIAGSDLAHFAIHMFEGEITAGLELYKIEAYKDKAVLSFKNSGDQANKKISPDFKLVEGNIYELILPKKLEKGEYAFLLGSSCYRFGID